MPCQGNGDGGVTDSGADQPDDDARLELGEVRIPSDEDHGDTSTDTSNCIS